MFDEVAAIFLVDFNSESNRPRIVSFSTVIAIHFIPVLSEKDDGLEAKIETILEPQTIFILEFWNQDIWYEKRPKIRKNFAKSVKHHNKN